jgi:hypothetical protein
MWKLLHNITHFVRELKIISTSALLYKVLTNVVQQILLGFFKVNFDEEFFKVRSISIIISKVSYNKKGIAAENFDFFRP